MDRKDCRQDILQQEAFWNGKARNILYRKGCRREITISNSDFFVDNKDCNRKAFGQVCRQIGMLL